MAANLTLANAAAFSALFPLTMGPILLFKPEIVPSTFETKFPLGFEDRKLAISITRLMAVRDAFFGGALLVPWYYQDNKTLGMVVLMGSAVLAADGLIQNAQAGRGHWLHWSAALATLGIAAGLLDWL
ncbi:hypothetical protein KC360_g8563 [Hortaea werneckii]|nr:hypothetical protein KC325_g8626 [Hortaea werneckii]KAI6986322.1 hypothetical protein KC359_g8793 [Hortaea werneckii]KAI7140552.1 hypothetical protein KC344_g8632 [Hortaea werneckii]KAI7167550.1 hypothetical protein KC360_g8563 [Hortaea werneckii]KAI7510479.1 hypothetical protein KC347_g4241 [Hortaea werneckii]